MAGQFYIYVLFNRKEKDFIKSFIMVDTSKYNLIKRLKEEILDVEKKMFEEKYLEVWRFPVREGLNTRRYEIDWRHEVKNFISDKFKPLPDIMPDDILNGLSYGSLNKE